jgi:apolipoprotein N-acyltransferase
VFTRDVTVQDVALRDGRTLATRLGAWPELVASLLALGALLGGLRLGPPR